MTGSLIKYIKLFIYSWVFCIAFLLLIGAVISTVSFFTSGEFKFPFDQVLRAVFFGFVGGSAISLAAILFKLLDWYRSRKDKKV
ncbi:hypothetical protein ACMV5L_22295 [Serratia plymuthica]|uniref:hypothetical protein n=1 Tax=Serratia plymuthica TaxID=82996 RepID=UPI003DA3A6A4